MSERNQQVRSRQQRQGPGATGKTGSNPKVPPGTTKKPRLSIQRYPSIELGLSLAFAEPLLLVNALDGLERPPRRQLLCLRSDPPDSRSPEPVLRADSDRSLSRPIQLATKPVVLPTNPKPTIISQAATTRPAVVTGK